MACYHPLDAWRAIDGPRRGTMTFLGPTYPHQPSTQLPCGQCIGCRLDRSRQWAIRCVHESQMHEKNCFITLTFNQKSLEQRENPASLDVRDWQLFIKRLRKKFGSNIRFFHCGEYGELNKRPHYHACLFNFDFPDKQLWSLSNDRKLYTSKILETLWPYGFATIGTVTFESAAYVARYIMKKINGPPAEDHYQHFNPDTGEITQLKPEYTTMSRRPGLGQGWLNKYTTDVYPSDQVIINGKKLSPPRYYNNKYEHDNPEQYASIKKNRLREAKKHATNNTPDRLLIRETIHNKKLLQLPRNLKEH